MIYKNKKLCKVRTITTFLSLNKNKNLWEEEIKKACNFCIELSKKFNKIDYEVQSIRIVTNAFGEYLDTTNFENTKKEFELISSYLNKYSTNNLRMRFAIGEAKTNEEIQMLPKLISQFGDLSNACVNIKKDDFDILDNETILQSAKVVKEISEITPRGEGNFNFTVNFNCKPFIPYFPASFHDSSLQNSYVVGLETPDLLVEVLKDYNLKNKNENISHQKLFKDYYDVLSNALQYHIDNIKEVIDNYSNSDFKFVGIDSSAAPSKNCSSMVSVYNQLDVEFFGASGSVEASSLLTKVFKSVKNTPLVGFSGLMLAVIEDLGLAKGTINKDFDIRTLLTNSAVCGIGLDTVPIEGDTSIKKIASIMRDTGTMAFRLNKPLTVRLFPYPGLKQGDITAYESDDLCNCAVLKVK
ncbi:hypothetical protein CPU12_00210 [Malaciobacter molluscorum LMG 25693]|uniref:DUF711 domain-containing protein n=1 Tax=Malaciobacter molluscorum LMG 25693 TaxID=870501 RepID=A0A2G1DL97_9BACT|nr:DUF711 family protein [Malaciobacter molluscorum]AXX92007.1 DUF711 domain-containing protein [Malaciobacter molluscorum LMG 25693]PHO19240.1 hypothetical protein CPU12_00210 [Malaciobacter molluscorum LMG 25693]